MAKKSIPYQEKYSSFDRPLSSNPSKGLMLRRPYTNIGRRSIKCQVWRIGGPKGKIHRVDGPAIEWENGNVEWWLNDFLDRENGPAVQFYHDESTIEEWWRNGKLHRENGPAVSDEHGQLWFRKGRLHRAEGPAAIFNLDDGFEYEWWWKGREFNFTEWARKSKLSDEKYIELKLRYC